jgi:hypothetical protein
MKKVLFICLLCVAYTACTSPAKKQTSKSSEIKTTTGVLVSKQKPKETGYRLQGHDLDTINKYRIAAGVPPYYLIIVDTTAHGFTELYYNEQKNGAIITVCDTRFF